MKKKNVRVNLMSYIFLFLVLAGVLYFMDSLNTRVNRIELKELNSYIDNKKISFKNYLRKMQINKTL